jgi:transposase
MTEQPKSGVRKTYTREYKLEAVRLASTGDRSIAQVARDLGINKNTLYQWRQDLQADPEQAFPGRGKLKPQDEELRRLRRENQALRQERDFLKRAAVWLAREAHGSTD